VKRSLSAAIFGLFVIANGLLAQAPQLPKVGAEHKMLHYFVGKWMTEGQMKASPFGPAGKFTSIDRNEMMPGGFFVVLHSDGKGPRGVIKELAVMGYNAEEKAYTYDGFTNLGEHEESKGTVQGDTWTWTNETKMGGKTVKGRFIIKEVSPTSYTFNYDISADGGWTNVMDGKSTKAK
jgi:uncharacterized protein DUF1579